MSNPNFNPTYSTWDIWRAGEMTQCLDDDLAAIEQDIADLEIGKADADHTHDGYASPSDLETLQSAINGKANANHTHTGYAASIHSHSDYVPYSVLESIGANYALVNHEHDEYEAVGAAASALTSANAYTDSKIDAVVGEGASTTLDTIGEISAAIEDNQDMLDTLNAAIGNKADSNHTHDYAANNHTHSGYASSSHNHDSKYAAASHSHDYAASSHNHSASNITSGTLAVNRGGTGSTSSKKNVTLSRGADVGTDSSAYGYDCQYIPYLNMCFVRVYVQPKSTWSADTEYEVATIGSSTYYPGNMVALSNYAQKEVSAYVNTSGQIVVRPYESVGTTYGIRLAGFWFCE